VRLFPNIAAIAQAECGKLILEMFLNTPPLSIGVIESMVV
tara:strand:+ start:1010 stop:1129 length:120 start_codon:yes stop_codon:yes gene_type:complete